MGTQSGREREAAPEGVRGAPEASDDACRARQAGPLATKEAAMTARYKPRAARDQTPAKNSPTELERAGDAARADGTGVRGREAPPTHTFGRDRKGCASGGRSRA